MTIEIDPLTGAPIVKSDSPDSPVGTENVSDKFKVTENPPATEAAGNSPVATGNSLPIAPAAKSKEVVTDAPLNNLIEQARQANQKLATKRAIESMNPVGMDRAVRRTPLTIAQKNDIQQVLNESSADSMFAASAYNRIVAIVEG